ncbi:MAG: hypothetical protein HF962_00730 [Sulfurovum sp.]|nr:hypothetical protein [Sulfurovum sp.]
MKIILTRHAKVLLDNSQKITASQMNAWVVAYNHASIDTAPPSKEVIQYIKGADVVLASSLSRTTDSLEVIGVEPIEKNSLFDEISLAETKGTWLKLSSKTWLIILRLMMLAGFGKKSKVYKEAKLRAQKASAYLIDFANKHESVALMGHGGMHWLVGKELEKLGWECVEQSGGSKNWGYRIYEHRK